MAAQNDVYASRRLNEGGVLVVLVAITEVRETDDELALFFPTQLIDNPLSYLRGMGVADSGTGSLGHQTLQLGRETEDSHTHTCALNYYIRFDKTLADGSRKIVVGTDDGKPSHSEKTRHIIKAVVKLMIANGARIIVHLVHQLYFHLALEQAVIDRSLREVSAVEEQQVRMLLAHFVQQGGATDVTSLVCLTDLDVVGRDRFDAGVCVTGVNYRQALCICHADEEQLTTDYQQER